MPEHGSSIDDRLRARLKPLRLVSTDQASTTLVSSTARAFTTLAAELMTSVTRSDLRTAQAQMLEHGSSIAIGCEHSSSVDNLGGEHSSSLDDLGCKYCSNVSDIDCRVDDLGGAERLEHSSSSMQEHDSSIDDRLRAQLKP